VKYRKNEAFVDVIEDVNLLMSAGGEFTFPRPVPRLTLTPQEPCCEPMSPAKSSCALTCPGPPNVNSVSMIVFSWTGMGSRDHQEISLAQKPLGQRRDL